MSHFDGCINKLQESWGAPLEALPSYLQLTKEYWLCIRLRKSSSVPPLPRRPSHPGGKQRLPGERQQEPRHRLQYSSCPLIQLLNFYR